MELRASEEQYRRLFTAMDEGYFLCDVLFDENDEPIDLLYLEANPAATRMVGEEYTGRRLRDIDPSYEAYWYDIFGRVARTGVGERLERYADPDKTWYDFYVFKVGDEDNRRVAVVFRDVTERKRAEEALRESEARFRAVAELVPDLLWSSDRAGATVWCNQRWCDYTGQTLEKAQGYGWLHAIHPDDRETSLRNVQAAVDAGQPLLLSHRIRRADGAYRWFRARAEPVRDADGAILQWLGAATDIDEERVAREELEARFTERTGQLAAAVEDARGSEQRLRLLLEQMPAILWTTDREMRITTLTGTSVPAWRAGQPPAVGREVSDLFIDTDLEGLALTVHQQALSGAPAGFDFRIDGHTYEAHLEQLHDAGGGENIGVIGVAHDVTDRTSRILQEEFISSVSHELQTPLTSIRAGLGLLDAALGSTLGPAERELLTASRRNVERLRLRIEQLLTANQAARGERPDVERSVIDLPGLVERALTAVQPLLQEKDQMVVVDMPDRLKVEGDRPLLEQVLANLLSNAHRHTPAGTTIAISCWLVHDQVRLAVHDTGPGIPPGELEAIFQRFYRAPGPQREGIGLGLAIARSAVEAQGGHLWAESSPGQGATFIVALPRAPDTESI